MLSGIGSAPSSNQYLASVLAPSATKQAGEAAALRAVDASVRAQALKARAQGGADATVTTQMSYTTGPDGRLYATSAVVNTTKRTNGLRDGVTPLANQQSVYDQNAPLFASSGLPQSLTDLLKPKAQLSPADEAGIYGSKDFLEDTLNNEQAQRRIRLQIADFGVRSQEAQHFRAANGFGSAPEYDYEVGPDGELYAVAGSVEIRAGAAATPEEAADNAATVARAALAATDVSAQDVSVARKAQADAAHLYAQNEYVIERETPIFRLVG